MKTAISCWSIISDEWLERLRAATGDVIERSKRMRDSDGVLELETGHSRSILLCL
jgi:hypothetical protein